MIEVTWSTAIIELTLFIIIIWSLFRLFLSCGL